MSIFKINKNKDYTVMSNYHLKDKKLSLKSKGLLSVMLSLPDNWDYTLNGLTSILKDGIDSVRSGLNELKDNGYLTVSKKMPNETKTGRIEYEYNIFEIPKQEYEKQGIEFLGVEKQELENPIQLNTKELNTKELKEIDNNKLLSKRKFEKPTIEEITEYCKSRNNNVDPQEFYDYYDVASWKDSNGKQIKNWKQKVIYWEKRNKEKNNLKNKKQKQQEEYEKMWEKIFEEEKQNESNGN